jgi:putative spermidine/putrescine transport system ATP-binding protein
MTTKTSDNASEVMVELRDVSKHYGSVIAVRETSVNILKGEFLTLLGPSGSGKTTLLNVIAGMLSPTTGEVFIEGRNVTSVPAHKRGLGMVFQNYALMPHMTVYENIAFPLQIRKMRKKDIEQRVSEVLELVRLPNLADRKPRELSGGQQQRVSIARCIVYNPSLILMDEPLGALDKKLREQMQLEIKRIHVESGITVMYVTHDQEEALNMSDRVMLLNEGNVEQLGTPNELYVNPVSEFAADFIGQSTLLDAEIVEGGETSVVGLGSLGKCRVVIQDPRVGARGKLLLRPEALHIVPRGETPEGHNALHGRVVDSLVTGGTVKHFVTLENGDDVAVQELTNITMTSFSAAEMVQIIWPIEAGLFLDR